MTQLPAVFCDRCNPDCKTSQARGWALMSAAEAISYGWAREPGASVEGTDDTHYCIDCLGEEVDEANAQIAALGSKERGDA